MGQVIPLWNRLSAIDQTKLLHSAHKGQQLESQWIGKLQHLLDQQLAIVLPHLEEKGRVPQSAFADIEEFLMRHAFSVSEQGLHVAETMNELDSIGPTGARLASPKRLPQSLAELRKIYDQYWGGKAKAPDRIRRQAEDIRTAYLEKVQSAWAEFSGEYRAGTPATKEAIARAIQNEARTSYGRAQTIVRTETTHYYNQSRRQFYDQSSAVTHYLFLAIRDTRTSGWCTEKTIDGKRGRHGLVYAKTDPLLARESPPCHYNCRSEVLPLTPANPSHLKLIQDERLWRRNHTCKPLLPNWVGGGRSLIA